MGAKMDTARRSIYLCCRSVPFALRFCSNLDGVWCSTHRKAKPRLARLRNASPTSEFARRGRLTLFLLRGLSWASRLANFLAACRRLNCKAADTAVRW